MARLIYSAITSLDGYIADRHGRFDWAVPDDEVHAVVNDLERHIGTHLYGRRLYEIMVFWETASTSGDGPHADYARIWQASDKVVFSRTLRRALSSRTRIERAFDADAVRRLKAAATSDLAIGGADLGGQAFGAGLVDECHLFLHPIVIGDGTRSLPADVRIRLELLDERRFASGVVHLHYAVRDPTGSMPTDGEVAR